MQLIKKKSQVFFSHLTKYCKENWVGLSMLLPILILLLLFSIIPIFSTFKNAFVVRSEYDFFTAKYDLENFFVLTRSKGFNNAIKNTTFLAFITTPISLFLGLFFALIISSICFKLSRNLLITALYSQFFISSFAIGLSFSFLFGQHNAFAKILGLKINFIGNDRQSVLWVYFFFQLWRVLPFNIVILQFAINKSNLKHYRSFKIDRLHFFEKFWYIHRYEIKHSFTVILYTNFIATALIYPPAVLGQGQDLAAIDGETITSYIYEFLGGSGRSIKFNPEVAYAASFLFFSYILFILFLFYLLRFKKLRKYYQWSKQLVIFIKNKKAKQKNKVNYV